jgi:salicylate hydroxylase
MRQAMVAALNNESTDDNSGNPNQWADRAKNIKLFGYDADAEVDRWWAETGLKEIGILGPSRL